MANNIKHFYNADRRDISLDYLTPIEDEDEYAKRTQTQLT
jgi:hypothetical protein